MRPILSRYLVFAHVRSLHSESRVGIHTILLYPHHICSPVSARIAVSNERLSSAQESRRLNQRYKMSTTASRKGIFNQQHFKIYATVSSKRSLSSEAQIQSLPNMKITALLALALAAVVAASPVAEPELVERKLHQSQPRLPRRLLCL